MLKKKSFKTEHPTRAFLFCVTLAPESGSFVGDVTARWSLVAYRRCLCPLGTYVIVMEPQNRGSMIVIVVLNEGRGREESRGKKGGEPNQNQNSERKGKLQKQI